MSENKIVRLDLTCRTRKRVSLGDVYWQEILVQDKGQKHLSTAFGRISSSDQIGVVNSTVLNGGGRNVDGLLDVV